MSKGNKIAVIVECKGSFLKKENVKKIVNEVLRLEGIKNNISVNLLFTGNKRIEALNKRFLRRDGPTDVITFGLKGASAANEAKGFLGEIAISVEKARENAKRFKNPLEKEISLYIIHGMLHLLGYGDESKKEKRVMKARQNKILKQI